MEFCEEMANLGKTVIVAALDGTFQRKVIVLIYLDEGECTVCPLARPEPDRTPLYIEQNVHRKTHFYKAK